MDCFERRREIMRILCRRRNEKIANLAHEFGVSERTIMRDIAWLSLTEPIYTQCGRFYGGVYIADDYVMPRLYMNNVEIAILQKIANAIEEKRVCELTDSEQGVFKDIIAQYTNHHKKQP